MGLSLNKNFAKRFGLDITENCLRIVEASFEHGGVSLVGAYEIPFHEDVIRRNKLTNLTKLANYITEARLEAKPNATESVNFCVSLPSNIIKLGHITLPLGNNAENKKIAEKKFAEDSGQQYDECYADADAVSVNGKIGTEFLCSVATKENIHSIVKISQMLSIVPCAVEPAVLANGRASLGFPVHNSRSICINIDYNSSFIALWERDQLIDVVNLPKVGLFQILEKNEILDQELSRDKINKLHLDKAKLRESISEIIENIIVILSNPAAKRSGDLPVTKIYLSGSGAHLPKIDYIFEKEFHIPAAIKSIKFSNEQSVGPEFVTAYGLAMRRDA
jgi:Tfp pilus assembly PilM family ATPase